MARAGSAYSGDELRGVLAAWSATHPASAALDMELLVPGGEQHAPEATDQLFATLLRVAS
jgi:hypothetical protein